jgi:hypothetical protein
MHVRVEVVRVYGTMDQYGKEPLQAPPGMPIVLEDFPGASEQVTVWLGPLPDAVREANLTRRAFGSLYLWC